jgi:guanylate kinase
MSGNLFIVTAPSGAGKTTLVTALLARDPSLRLSVSYTTRAPRPGEQDGREYHFVDVATFETMRDRGEFLEWAHVHGGYYGTSHAWLEKQTAGGNDVLLEIDWQGARQVRRAFHGAIGIFVVPPLFEDLERRLRGRGKDPESVIQRRLENAREEIRHAGEFDYVIINNELQEALEDLVAIVRAARLRYGVQAGRHCSHFAFRED